MNHKIFPCILFAVLILALSLPTYGNAQPPGAVPPQSAEHDMMVVILHPLVQVYEGDTITVPYIVEDLSQGGLTLAPLTPGEAEVSASLGSASVVPDGLGGSITYTAEKAGQESIVLTVSNYFGSAAGSLELEVKPRPNYNLAILVVSQAKDEAGGAFLSVFTGQGEFSYAGDSPPEGKGTADEWFNLWVANNAFVCAMDPVVQGSSPFTITESSLLGPIAHEPGSLEEMVIDLNFEPMSLNASTINCQGLGGVTAAFPWPAASGNPNEKSIFTGLYFSGDGGINPIQAPSSWGYVRVERKSQ